MPSTNALKLVMDATKVTFIDNQFDLVTAFYSFMYISDSELDLVIREAHRVLKPEGVLEIWDIEMPSINEVQEDIFIAQLDVLVAEHVITTGYGVQLKKDPRILKYYQEKLEENLFRVMEYKTGTSGELYIKAAKLV